MSKGKRQPCQDKNQDDSVEESETGDQVFASMSQLQFDFLRHKIGVTKGTERRDTRRELLLKMGAKPEKRGQVNYRQLMDQRRIEKEDARIQMLEDSQKNALHKKLRQNRKKKKKKDKKVGKKNAGITKISRDRIRSVRKSGGPGRNRKKH